METRRHVAFWIGLMMLGFLLGPLIRSGASMERFVLDEIAGTRAALGDRVANGVVNFASSIFADTPLGVAATLAKSAQHNERDRALSAQVGGTPGAAMSMVFNSYLQGLVLQAFVASMRLAIAMVWILVLAPLLVAALFDGFMQRSVKRSEFGKIRPATFSVASMLVVPLIFAPFLYLVIPLPISPLIAPAWAFVLCLPLSLLISNTQPLFGR